MAVRRLRRSRKRWRIGVMVAVFLFLVFQWMRPSNERLDPNGWIAESGEYEVHGVAADGAIEVVVPTDDGQRIADVKLLAVCIHEDAEQAALLLSLRQLIRASSKVRLRFDRRRIHEQTRQLQAYVFAGDVMINEELARLGIVYEDTHSSDSGPMTRRIKKAEQEARAERRGVWN